MLVDELDVLLAFEDVLDHLVIETLACHFGRLAVFVIDRIEAGDVALRLVYALGGIALGHLYLCRPAP